MTRREVLRLTVPLAMGPLSLLTMAQNAHADPDTEVSLKATESTEGWSGGVTTATDDTGKPAIVWTPAGDASVATLNYALGMRTKTVAHTRQIRFRYRVDGAASTTLHFKLVAAPLASGFQAVYRLPFPDVGKWREAVIPVQEYDTVWGAKGTPQTKDGSSDGSLQFRVAKPAGANLTLTVGEIRVEPLPKDAPVNTAADPKSKTGVKPAAPNAPKRAGLVTPALSEALTNQPHPRLLFPAAEVSAVRNRAQKTPGGRETLAALVTRCDASLAQAVQVPDHGGQWDHWYVCPKHGATLRAENPHRHVCSVDGEVFSGYPYDDVLLSGVHQRYAENVRDLGIIFQVSSDARYAAKAREILLAYAGRYRSLPWHDVNNKPMVGGGRVMAQTAMEAQWLISMAQGCDLVWETLTPADREALRVGLFYPAVVEVIQKHDTGIESDQCWRNSAIGLTGLLFGDAALVADALDHPERGMQAQIAQGVTDDGFWYERRWDYHFEAMNALAPLAEAAQNAGIAIYRGEIGERYKRLYLLPVEMAMPDHLLPKFDDNGWNSAQGNPLYVTAFARWGDPRLAVPLSTGRGGLATLFSDAPAPATPTRPVSRNFPEAGYAVLRAGEAASPAYLAVKYGPAGGVHGHPDKLSFVFWSQRRLWFDDPGPSTRGSSSEANWYKTTFAHSTLVVNEENQNPATGKCLDFQSGAMGSAVLADAGAIYDGIRFRRAVFLLDVETAVVLDLATATDGKSRTFDFVLHPSGDWVAPLPPTGVSGMEKPGYQLLRDVRTTLSLEPGGAHFDLKPGARVAVATPTPQGVRLLRSMGVGRVTAEGQASIPCLVVRHTGTTAAIQASLLACGPRSESASLRIAPLTAATGNDALAAYVEFGGKRCLILANPERVPLRVGNDYRGSDRLAIIPLKPA